MTSISERKRKRYAEDPEYRERVLAYNSAYAEKHRAQINERRRQKRATNPEFCEKERARCSENWRKIKYGLTMEDYDRMLARQQGACAICKQKSHERLCVDHSHSTGEVRGLLCRKCNTGLGCYDDESSRIREAAAYVDAWLGLPES